MMQFLLAFSRQGKIRLQKWYISYDEKNKKKILGDLVTTILYRESKLCNFLQWEGLKIVYRRYASMVFCCATDKNDNDLLTLEIIHRYVELLDRYFDTVCELDIIFNYDKAYFILDEFILGGEVQEPSKDNVLKAVEEQDRQEEVKVTSTSRWKLKTKQKKKVHKQTGSKSK